MANKGNGTFIYYVLSFMLLLKIIRIIYILIFDRLEKKNSCLVFLCYLYYSLKTSVQLNLDIKIWDIHTNSVFNIIILLYRTCTTAAKRRPVRLYTMCYHFGCYKSYWNYLWFDDRRPQNKLLFIFLYWCKSFGILWWIQIRK